MFHYYASPADPGRHVSAFVATLPGGLTDVRSLLAVLGALLRFPPYYGMNFDAFWDCVRDLDGIEEHVVILVHRDVPDIPEERLQIYIELLRDAVLYWRRHGREHRFEVWFARTDADRVETLLGSAAEPGDDE